MNFLVNIPFGMSCANKKAPENFKGFFIGEMESTTPFFLPIYRLL